MQKNDSLLCESLMEGGKRKRRCDFNASNGLRMRTTEKLILKERARSCPPFNYLRWLTCREILHRR